MRAIFVLLAALSASLFGATACRANAIYIINNLFAGPIGVDGSITTDGKVGVLSLDDILSFNILAAAPVGVPIFTPDDTIVSLIGDDLVSTGRYITFAYGADDGGVFSFENTFGLPGSHFWCNGTAGQGTCAQGMTVVGADPQNQSFGSVASTTILGAVPEPATWTMMLIGFAGLGFTGYRQARKGQAATA